MCMAGSACWVLAIACCPEPRFIPNLHNCNLPVCSKFARPHVVLHVSALRPPMRVTRARARWAPHATCFGLHICFFSTIARLRPGQPQLHVSRSSEIGQCFDCLAAALRHWRSMPQLRLPGQVRRGRVQGKCAGCPRQTGGILYGCQPVRCAAREELHWLKGKGCCSCASRPVLPTLLCGPLICRMCAPRAALVTAPAAARPVQPARPASARCVLADWSCEDSAPIWPAIANGFKWYKCQACPAQLLRFNVASLCSPSVPPTAPARTPAPVRPPPTSVIPMESAGWVPRRS